MRRVLLAAILLCTPALTVWAQDVSTNPAPSADSNQTLPDAPSTSRETESKSFAGGVGTAVKTIGLDEWNILKAPFQKKSLIWDGLVLGATGVLIANDESVARQVPVSWHQTSVDISNACTYGTAAAAGGIYLTGLFTHDKHAQRTGVLSAEAAIDSFLLYGSMKLIFNRQRPYQSVDGKFFYGNFSSGSFPSGHSAFAWTLASVVAHEYPAWPVQLAMYGLATTVATTRVTGGQHFPSDVFVGSTLGYLVGAYVANKDKHAHDQPKHSGNRVKRLPNVILEHVAIQ